MFNYLFFQPSPELVNYAFVILRVGIGIITMILGIPKIGGVEVWRNLGTTFMGPLGIHFLPVVWGFLGFAAQFLGGVSLVLGLGTRLGSFALVIMMIIATAWHLQRGDDFNVYSFPLSLIFVYLFFMLVGSGPYSLESYL